MAIKPNPPFGKPEKPNLLKSILLWGFIAIGVIGIIWMIAANPHQKTLNCSSGVPSSLISFGTCIEE